MGDCIWNWMDVCNCDNWKCKKYLSANSDEGYYILQQYEQEIKELLTPLKEKMINLKNEYNEQKEGK